MSHATIVCERCRGCGRQRITGQRQRVLDAVARLGQASPCDLVDALGGVETETAQNRAANVCTWLLRHGLLRVVACRENDGGRRVIYAATSDAPTRSAGEE